jgi:hypothetical protein
MGARKGHTHAAGGGGERGMKKIEFNFNDYVRVKLTQHGREVHRQNHDNLFKDNPSVCEYRPPVDNPEGWSRWQIWELMQQFGPHIYMGGKNCFEMTGIIEK